jgi:hypothetical protein
VEEQTFVRWVELPEGQTVRFDDVPGLIAGALHKDEFAQAAAEINLEAELRAMVQSGELMVRDPLTLGRHTFPIGQALRDSALLPLEDLRPLLASRGIGLRMIPYGNGPTHWTMENAARNLGEIQGWSGQQIKTLCEQMLGAAQAGAMAVRHPHTDLPIPLHKRAKVCDFYELVTRDDVNAWLVSMGAPYRWVTCDQAEAGPRYIAGRRLWKLAEAVEYVAALDGFGVTPAALLKRAAKAAADCVLTVRDPEDGEPRHGSNLSGFFVEWLYAEDFNAWLASAGFREPYRLLDDPPSEARQPGPVATAAEPVPEADPTAPLPLATGDVAFCFDGLRYTEAQWKKPLGNKPKWLAACVAIPGRRGISETRWNPVLIGAALVHAGHVSARSVRARFQSRPMLTPWLDAWKTYEADHIESA